MHRLRSLLLPTVLVALVMAVPAAAQPDTSSRVVPMHGVGDNEFLLSGYVATRPRGGIADLWNFASALGINTIQPALSPEELDTLASAADTATTPRRIIIRGLSPIQDAGIGRELQFYLFDSVQSELYRWQFTQRSGGRSAYNAAAGVREQRYSLADETSPGQRVASGIAYDWRPWQTRRFPARPYDTTAQDASALIDWYRYRVQANRNAPTFHVVVRGRLLEPVAAPAVVLRLELVYEVARGQGYVDTSGVRRVADADLEIPYATVDVASDRLTPPAANGGGLVEASLPINLVRAAAAVYGPLYPGNDSRRLDLRVIWTGAAPLALHSIALRDSVGELVLGSGTASVAYRGAIVAAARRAVYGPAGAGQARRSVIRLMSGIEPHATEFATSVAMANLLRDSLRAGFRAGDALPIHNEGGTSDRGLANFHRLVPGDAIFSEVLLAPPVDTSARYGDDLYRAYQDRMRLTVVQVPSLRAHNGGRFQIPLLEPTAEAIERDYEPVLQILRFGAYYPGGAPRWPWSLGNVTRLGEAAEASAATGRRMIATVFTTCELHLRVRAAGDPLDTLMSHAPEAAELRAMVNLSLAYGARGVHYYWLGNYTNHLYRSPANPALWIGSNDSWGSNGPYTADTLLDRADTFALTDNVPTPRYPEGTPRVLFPDFYLGYGVRTRELKWINRWLARIGPELARLRWRDSYSMHAATSGPHTDPGQVPARPLPQTEIVRGVRAYSRAGAADPPERTYVELGVFQRTPGYTAAGARDTLHDADHIYVVNRRCFERPGDIAAGGQEGARMDSLAESRRVVVQLNLGRAAHWRRQVVRVREIAADTTRLPLWNVARVPLDTFVVADSAVEVWLRPGGGALLEITYPLAELLSLDGAPAGPRPARWAGVSAGSGAGAIDTRESSALLAGAPRRQPLRIRASWRDGDRAPDARLRRDRASDRMHHTACTTAC